MKQVAKLVKVGSRLQTDAVSVMQNSPQDRVDA